MMGRAHQNTRPKLAVPVPPSAWPLLASVAILDGDQPPAMLTGGGAHYGLGTADLS